MKDYVVDRVAILKELDVGLFDAAMRSTWWAKFADTQMQYRTFYYTVRLSGPDLCLCIQWATFRATRHEVDLAIVNLSYVGS